VRTGDPSTERVDLSLLDMFEYPIPIDVIYVFKEAVPAAALEESLRATLRQYPELLGRMHKHDDGSLYVDCNDAGAMFTSARADVSVAGLSEADLAGFSVKHYLAKNRWLRMVDRDVPLFSVQHTLTACGGMILGMQVAHSLMDGEALVEFMRNWARVHAGEPAKTGRMYRYMYDGFFDAAVPVGGVPDKVPGFKRMSRLTLYWKVLKLAWDSRSTRSVVLTFSSQELKNLRAAAREDADAVSASNALLVHLWRIFADLRPNADDDSCGLFLVVGTRHLREQNIPRTYWGNAVWHVRADSTYGELRNDSLGGLTNGVQQTQAGVDYAYVCQGMQWLRGEHERGNLLLGVVPDYELMRRDFFATNMFMLKMYDPDFGTGTAAWVTTREPPIRWMIRLFPRPSGRGIAVHCTVPKRWEQLLASPEVQQRIHMYGGA